MVHGGVVVLTPFGGGWFEQGSSLNKCAHEPPPECNNTSSLVSEVHQAVRNVTAIAKSASCWVISRIVACAGAGSSDWHRKQKLDDESLGEWRALLALLAC